MRGGADRGGGGLQCRLHDQRQRWAAPRLAAPQLSERRVAQRYRLHRRRLFALLSQLAHVRELRKECEQPPSMEPVPLSDATLAELRRRQARRRPALPLIVQPALQTPAAAVGPTAHGCRRFCTLSGRPQRHRGLARGQ
ncbi:hypothetical protein CF642_38840, partial [Burkholderia pseudomallei]